MTRSQNLAMAYNELWSSNMRETTASKERYRPSTASVSNAFTLQTRAEHHRLDAFTGGNPDVALSASRVRRRMTEARLNSSNNRSFHLAYATGRRAGYPSPTRGLCPEPQYHTQNLSLEIKEGNRRGRRRPPGRSYRIP